MQEETSLRPVDESSPLSEYVFNYQETLREELAECHRDTRKHLLYVSAILFVSELLGLFVANASGLLYAWPFGYAALFVALSFWAMRSPMAAVISAIGLYAGIIILVAATTDITVLFSGWLVKALLVYQFIRAFREAQRAGELKQQLKY